jgi:hypothetical protein
MSAVSLEGGAVYNGVASGEIVVTEAAVVLPSIACRLVAFCGLKANTGLNYIGGKGVTAGAGTNTATAGIQIQAGVWTPWIPISNLNLLYLISGNSTTDSITYLALS